MSPETRTRLQVSTDSATRQIGGVLLLHGLARTARSMETLACALRRDGFEVLNLDCPTRHLDIVSLADHVESASARWNASLRGPLHVVGHSLGGLVARAWMARHPPAKLGRVVCLGTPNGGSEIADRLCTWTIYRRVFGPAGAELTTRRRAQDESLAKIDARFGLIAGTRALDPIGWMLLPKPNDGKVAVASALSPGASHLVLPVTHTFMMRDPAVIAATRRFLLEGRFA